MQYNTKNRKAIENFFRKNEEKWYSAEEVAKENTGIGRSSVYRIVGELYDCGFLLKEYSEKSGSTVYKADTKHCREHFHLMCTGCGKLVHIEDKHTDELLSAIAETNEFLIDKGKTVLYGKCDKCRRKERE